MIEEKTIMQMFYVGDGFLTSKLQINKMKYNPKLNFDMIKHT